MSEPWWKTRFELLAARAPTFVGTVESASEERVWLEALLPRGARVLDLGCGGGRHAIQLARAGFDVTAVDGSPGCLELARRAAGPTRVAWHEADLRNPNVEGPFDGIVLMDSTLGGFDDDADHLSVLTACRERLAPGGRLVLHQMHQPFWSARTGLRSFQVDGWTAQREYRLFEGQLEDALVLSRPDERVEVPTQRLRLWTPTELATLLGGAGLRITGLYGGKGFQLEASPTPLRPDSAMMWVVAEPARARQVG